MIKMKIEVYNDKELLESTWIPIQENTEHSKVYWPYPTDGLIALTDYKLKANVVRVEELI